MTPIPGRFIEVHVLQPIPFANLNRDDTNAIKTVRWGGADRTRVSSQCWKRAMRLHLQQHLGQTALRTRRLPELIAQHLQNHHAWPADLAERAGRHIAVASSVGAEAPKKKKDENAESNGASNAWATAAMVYIPAAAVAELAELAIEHREKLEDAKEPAKFERKHVVIPTDKVDAILRSRNGIINLFGRMLAQVDEAKVDGAVQVAHCFTTHATDTEVDYFSAVDDVTSEWADTTGSAHMGHAEHSAGVLYRNIVVDLQDLHRNLGGGLADTRELAAGVIRAALLSLPHAKKNSTAPNTIPALAHLTVRADRPVSYAAAFEKPVAAGYSGGGHTDPSVKALSDYATAVNGLLGTSGLLHHAHATLSTADTSGLGERVPSFDALIDGALDSALDGAVLVKETV
ncbi:type I-E CRISPR-associated protein Cas7/Cse4/CasC [Actinomadura sp. NEAU-AAG7]|uniref:type I-E CRISPR-associated protein Cas7/Cse4/CasC n=1 Tax=Actinomadura sp. NEAU-AAG7 TaxID=2839640 RepID=UPI001BE4B1C3|nr:type I-E CRISPR-associated protein Cas7/Cse4/CasC [Actinomadura sp. NEAU-AAG7]MBT2207275.1 type I-E CRISPR-associated protein Cas7/Cse4/CasC [Actinomadura sp. NEAU-AAG7]